jgi:putative cell wall-binding protein
VVLVDGADEAPVVIQEELTRLQPQKIVVLGGPQAISSNLELTMERFAPVVRRISGADRFEVAGAVAGTFMGGNTTAYIASGENFPDALSAAAIAGDDAAPVLLVTKTQLPDATREALEQMPFLRTVVIVGGPAAISSEVALGLAQYGALRRVDGADRFAVSAAASEAAFCADNKATVYIASGENFPDALSGSVAAILNEGPVLLVRHDAIPAAIAAELRRLKPQRIVVLGGEQAVAKSVEVELAGFLRK